MQKDNEQLEGFYVLIDYDNVRKFGHATREDTELLLEDLWSQLVLYISTEHPGIEDVDVLLYGGWIDEYGAYSDLATWVRVLVSDFRGLREGIRFRPSLAEHLISVPTHALLGTVRPRRAGLMQKMVDTMLCCDLIHLCMGAGNIVTVVSDDDDFVPATIYAATQGESPVILLRDRDEGKAINDSLLRSTGVRVSRRGSE